MFDGDIVALVDDSLARGKERITVTRLVVTAGTEGQRAELTLDVDGVPRSAACSGDGPVDAVFKAIRELTPHDAMLQLYQVHAVTEGADAQAHVTVRLEEGGHISTGTAADTDTMTASAMAYVSALNNLIARREKAAPDTRVAGGFR